MKIRNIFINKKKNTCVYPPTDRYYELFLIHYSHVPNLVENHHIYCWIIFMLYFISKLLRIVVRYVNDA